MAVPSNSHIELYTPHADLAMLRSNFQFDNLKSTGVEGWYMLWSNISCHKMGTYAPDVCK